MEVFVDWLVTLEQAEKLKDIKFNKRCHFYMSYGIDSREGDVLRSSHFNNFKRDDNYNIIKRCTSIPTHEQVFEWFSEKGFYGCIEFDAKQKKYVHYVKNGEKKFLDSKEKKYSVEYKEARYKLVNLLISLYNKREENRK